MISLREAIADPGQFVVTFEAVPGRGWSGPAVEEAGEFARKIVEAQLPVHAVSITDNPGGNPAISPDILGREVRAAGLDTLVHFSCKDSNRNTLESRATALARDGLGNLLVVTGDYPVGGYEGTARPAFDLDSVQAIRLLKGMNAGLEVPGRKPGTFERLPATDFLLGCAVSPFKKHESELLPQFYKLEKKIAAGADFIIPQLGYDVRKFAEILKYLKYRGLDVPVLGNVYVVTRTVARLMNRGLVPGCVVTDELLERINQEAKAEDKGKGARLERAAQLTAIFRGMGFRGVHIGGFGLKFPDFQHILERAGEIGENWREHIGNFRWGQQGEFYLFPDDPELTFAPETLEPVRTPRKRAWSINFHLSRAVHRLVFTEGTLLYRLERWIYGKLDRHPLASRFFYFFERAIKRWLYRCKECGDCALFDMAYLCPMSRCAKSQRNGPCGGGKDTRCEVYDDRPCVWTLVYQRYAATGQLEKMRRQYVPPVDYSLAETSSWANFFLKRDHAAKMPPETPDGQAGDEGQGPPAS